MEQLIKETKENASVHWWGTVYPGSEYYLLSGRGDMPIRIKNMGRFRRAVTTVTGHKITITGGGFGRKQTYEKGTWGYRVHMDFVNGLLSGKFKGYKECKRDA